MISIKKILPLLQTGSCVFADYDEAWIELVLEEAAEAAGIKLSYGADIAKAVIAALQDKNELQAMPLELLFIKMRDSLHALGLESLAKTLQTQTPAVRIALDSIAQESPIPLFFYAELNNRIKKLRSIGVNRYHFSGIIPCSLILGQRRRRCPATMRNEEELQSFLRHNKAVHAHHFSCSAS